MTEMDKRIEEYKERLKTIGITNDPIRIERNGRIRLSVKVICHACGEHFYKTISDILRKSGRTKDCCSIECRMKLQRAAVTGENTKRWKGGPVERECIICSKKFFRNRDQIETRNSVFCSTKCFGTWKSLNWSKENHPRWKGGYLCKDGSQPYYGGWDRIRRQARERDGNKCTKCGKTGKRLHVHHKKPFRLFDTPEEAHNMENLITLCSKCHSKEERLLKTT